MGNGLVTGFDFFCDDNEPGAGVNFVTVAEGCQYFKAWLAPNKGRQREPELLACAMEIPSSIAVVLWQGYQIRAERSCYRWIALRRNGVTGDQSQ